MSDQATETKRVVFRVGKQVDFLIPTHADIPNLLKWVNDFKITRNTGTQLPWTEKNEKEWLDRQADNRMQSQVFIMATKENGAHRPIGTIGFNTIDWISRFAVLGISIGEKSLHGKGLGTEAVLMMVHYGLIQCNLQKIELGVYAFNTPAIACYKKCGFFEKGRLRRHHFTDGEYHDAILMGIFHEDFMPIWRQYQAA